MNTNEASGTTGGALLGALLQFPGLMVKTNNYHGVLMANAGCLIETDERPDAPWWVRMTFPDGTWCAWQEADYLQAIDDIVGFLNSEWGVA